MNTETFRVQYHHTPADNNFCSVCLLSCNSFFPSFFLNGRLEWKTAVMLALVASDSTIKRKQIFFRSRLNTFL